MTNAVSQIIARHFNKHTLAALAKRNVRIIGTTVIPQGDYMPWANGQTGYSVDDNGTGRILSHSEVLALV